MGKQKEADLGLSPREYYTKKGHYRFVGQTITAVSYMKRGEAPDEWENLPIILHLSDGSYFYPIHPDEEDGASIYHVRPHKGKDAILVPMWGNE